VDELLYNRRYSLFLEGHRWIDYRRHGRLDALPRDGESHVVHDRYPIPTAAAPAEYRIVEVSPQGTEQPEQARHVAQAETVRDALSLSTEIRTAAYGRPEFPTSCDAFTLLLALGLPGFTRGTGVAAVVPATTITGTGPDRAMIGAVIDLVFRFDEIDELIRDDDFDSAVARLREAGVMFTGVELAGETRPSGDRENPKLVAVVDALRAEGLLQAAPTIETSKLNAGLRDALRTADVATDNVILLRRG
jgi:hypothetical protein